MESETYYCRIQNGIVIIQEEKYLQYGWFIYIQDNIISLKEIPYGGGEEIHVNTFTSILEAIEAGKKLT